ncbi:MULTISPECIES: RDD family protein [unclassified Streptomyces]|uniref:RDD family protein n=1 Tax=unclassified Streptomyces TaxID=2593676 RepID=UPI003D71EF52
MTTEPPPGSGGEPPEDDPFRKQPPPPQGGHPYGGQPYGGDPYGGRAHGGDPYGGHPADPQAGMPPLADSGRRTLARLIDMVLVFIALALLSWAFGLGDYSVDSDEVQVGRSLSRSVVAAVLYIAYDTFLTARTGQTLGKKWLGLRVANLDNGATPSLQTSLLRALVLWVPFAFCCFVFWTAIAGGWSFFDKPYKQGLHDKAAKTVVVTVN